MIKMLSNIGKYFIMLGEIFRRPTKWRIMKNLIFKEVDELIIGSLGIVAFLSFFIGAVVTIQCAVSLTTALMRKDWIGFTARQSMLFGFSPTIASIIMAARMDAYITSRIGPM